jgi:hypothetical protein
MVAVRASARARYFARAEGVPFRVQTECSFHGVDALRERQEIEHLGARQDQGHDTPLRDVVA